MRGKVKGDHPGPFELSGRRCELADYFCECGPFCDVRGMQKDYFFSMIFNDERPDLASLLAGRITGYHWCCLFPSRRPWGTAVATIVDTLKEPITMENKYSQIISFLHELGVQQTDLVCLPKDHKQAGNSCGLQAATIVAWVVRGDGGDTGDNGP